MNISEERIALARKFVREHHKDITHETKSGYHRPQLEHLQEVADLTWVSGGNDTEMAAAWLHDTVEDTPVKIEEIEKLFGKEVAEIVHGLTDLDEIKDLPVEERKKKQAERVASESRSVRTIKLADQTSNVRFVSTDPSPGWKPENIRQYVLGTKPIADACKGISPVLDELFEREYRKALERLDIK